MAYKEVLPHSKTKLPAQDQKKLGLGVLLELVHMSLSVPTLMAIGAFAQALLMFLPVRRIYSFAPAALYLLSRITFTTLVTHKLLSNPYLKDVIPFKWSAVVPQQNGHFPPEDMPPTNERVAILLLSATINHPMGWLGAPYMKAFGGHFIKMRMDLAKKPQSETGFLGQTKAYIPLENGALQVLNISYWRSAAHVLKYAESPLHREAVRWWRQNQADIPHIGIMHETFESPPGLWESVYIGFQPTLLGATTYLQEGEKTLEGHMDDEWIQPVLDARRGKLARTRGRMGWNVQVGGHPDF